MLGNLGLFFLAVADHFLFWVGLLLMIEPYLEGAAPQMLERLRRYLAHCPDRRKKIFRIAGAIALFVACFQAWSTEHEARLNAETVAHDRTQRDAVKARLQQFYIEAGRLIERPLQRNISDEDFKKYVDEVQSWVDDSANWIEQNMGLPAKERFLDRSGMLAMSYSAAVNTQHNAIISNLTRLRLNLKELIENSAWDKPASTSADRSLYYSTKR